MNKSSASLIRYTLLIALLVVLLAGCARQPKFELNNVQGHLPDLAFELTSDEGKSVDAADFKGKVALLYFGYTHCPDVCPLTLTHLHVVMQKLGAAAKDARILFVSVDPARDTPAVLHAYAHAFDPHIVGLTGEASTIEALAKRYRAVFNRESPKVSGGNYEVIHSSAIYIFDRAGHARLIATPIDSLDAMTHDLKMLLGESA
ncbi:MAG: SCO family protein [Rhodanobacteraceae bacterium]